MQEQRDKFESEPELANAAEESIAELMKRHSERMRFRDLVLAKPDGSLLGDFERLGPENKTLTKEGFLAHINRLRAEDPDFLEPLGPSNQGQLQIMTSGAAYNIARLTASLTSSHLLTDLHVKWREIEFDRRGRSSETSAWSPFAKAVQDTPFKYLGAVTLEDALAVRSAGRLEDLRAFLRRVWRQACDANSYESVNGKLLADELYGELRKADEEWKQIDRDLLKNASAIASGLAAAGPLIGTGAGEFLAAASLIGGIPLLASSTWQRHGFADEFPAGFFLQIKRKR